MTSRTTNNPNTTLTTVLVACVALAGTRSLLAVAPVQDISADSPFAAVPDVSPDLSFAVPEVSVDSPFAGMFADWGLDTSADLNCDGTVDIHDFLEALRSGDDLLLISVMTDWGGGSVFDINCDGTVGIADFLAMAGDMTQTDVQSEVDALFADWGIDTSYDLNCDGVVNINDYLEAIRYGDGLLILGVITHWGTGSAYDLDCDGTVGIADYLLLLGDMADAASQAQL